MPQSSVFLRLQWPSSSTSSESSHEVSSGLSDSNSLERSPAGGADPTLPTTNLAPVPATERDPAPEPSSSPKMKDPSSEKRKKEVLIPLSKSSSSPSVQWKDHVDDDDDDDDDDGGGSFPSREDGGVERNYVDTPRLKKRGKVKLRDKDPDAKSKRMIRSLSTSSATVSTSTEPEDFLYACIVAKYSPASLPRNLNQVSPRIIVPTIHKEGDKRGEGGGGVGSLSALSLVRESVSEDLSFVESNPDEERGQKQREMSRERMEKVEREKEKGEETRTLVETPNCSTSPSASRSLLSTSYSPLKLIKRLKERALLFSLARKSAKSSSPDAVAGNQGGSAAMGLSPRSPPDHPTTPPPPPHPVPLLSVAAAAAEEEAIPDLLSGCNLDASYFHDDSFESQPHLVYGVEEEEEEEEDGAEVEGETAEKKTVQFLLPPQYCDSFISEGGESAASGEFPASGYAELDAGLLPPNGGDPYRNTPSPGLDGVPNDRYVRWRDPDLHEVIDFLSNPNNIVKANAAAYLQHLCYMDDATKQKTRILGGIPPLVALLSHDLPELHRNACGALRNLSYGRQNDENKRAIKDAGGLPILVRLLRKTVDNEVKELVTGILWNLSSCEDLKQCILDEALGVLVSHVIIPCSGWEGGEVDRDPNNDVWWSTVFKNASGIIRNISSAGEYARTKLRHSSGLVDSLFCVIKLAIQGNSHDNKSVENCVCILRNLSYRCQEVEDPNYDKNQLPTQSRATATGKEEEEDGSDKCGDNLGCFGGSRKKKEMVGGQLKDLSSGQQRSTGSRGQTVRGMELLWQPELVVPPYLQLLSDCSNPETLEAAAGAIQNLAACYWQPSIDVRAAVRKEKGLPILVELLRMEVDRVVCAVATALRNLAIDQRNKELIGKYAMRDLVQKLPSQNSHDTTTSDETIAAVLATLNEVIKKNAEFSRSLLDAGGVDRLVYITRQRGRYSPRVVKFSSQVLFSMWGHQELREVYKKAGWKEQDFVSKSVAARNAAGGANSPTANNTLNRPMASQGGTRYEDRTIQRSNNHAKHHQYQRREEVPLADLGYGGDSGAPGGVRIYGPVQGKGGEPVYAKVNREKKRNRQFEGGGVGGGVYGSTSEEWVDVPPPAYSAIHPQNPLTSNYSEPHLVTTSPSLAPDAANNNNNEMPHIGVTEPAGDSWV